MEPKKRSVYMTDDAHAALTRLRLATGWQTWAVLGNALQLMEAAREPPRSPSSRRAIAQKPASGSEREFWQNK